MDKEIYDIGSNYVVTVHYESVEHSKSHRYYITLTYWGETITDSTNVIDNDKSPINTKEEALRWAKGRMNYHTDKLNAIKSL